MNLSTKHKQTHRHRTDLPGLCCKPGGGPDRSHSFVHHIRRSQLALCCTAPRTATAPSLAWPPVTPAQLPAGMTTTGG
uniref:Uncharacterized protein n=1 Tax=Balaenoptera musculus TaxID=9771 RepID=A0A8C0CHR4_BALMU